MIKGMWNYAIKVKNLQQATEFYRQYMGAEARLMGEIYGSQYSVIRMGGTRVVLFDKAPYEKDLGVSLPPGLLHVVYEVDDLESELRRLRNAGIKLSLEPRVVEGWFGVQKLAVFDAPDNVRTELIQVLEDSGKA